MLGDDDLDFDHAIDKFAAYLQAHLVMPCEVTGIEDFKWEEPYTIGGWSQAEYRRLKKTQPSYTDRYLLLGISRDKGSPWMLMHGDIAARLRRISDGKEFVLGLSELKAIDRNSPCHQLLEDYSVWFVNSR